MYINGSSGAIFNPAMAMVMTCFQCGLVNGGSIRPGVPLDTGGPWAKFIWVYMIFPFLGSLLAFYGFKKYKMMTE